MGLGTDPEFAPYGAGSDRSAVPALLADVSEPDHPETLADPADPGLFFRIVCFRAVRVLPDAAADGTADPCPAGSFRYGHFHPVPVCPAVPFSFFCTVCLHSGRDCMVFGDKKPVKKGQ